MQVEGGNTHIESLADLAAAAGFSNLLPDAGLTVQTPDGQIVAVSAQAEIILGLTFDQMRGRTSSDTRWAAVDEFGRPVPGGQHPSMRALETGLAIRNAVLGVHRPGSATPGHHVWLVSDSVPLIRPGEIVPWAVVNCFRPATGERLRVLELRDSERVYRMIAEHSSDMVAWQLLRDSSFLWVSPASRAMLGIDPDKMVGACGIDLIHPDDRATWVQWWRSITGDGAPRLTARMRRADGSFRWIETAAHVLPAGDRGPKQVITTQRDVTDRVVAERARDAAVRLMELAMEHATVGVAFGRIGGAISSANPAMCNLLGRSADDLVGHDLFEFTAGSDHEGDRGFDASTAGDGSHDETEWQFRRPDGTVVWCIRTVIELPGESGEVTHLMVQLQDVTALKEAAAQLEKAALTDSLTGLPNRAVLEDRLTRALASAQRTATHVGVLFVDLDHFKQINDTLGHDVGDSLLREVASRLTSNVRHIDSVVRLGGDEFVIVREHLSDVTELDSVADRIRDALDKPFLINGHDIAIGASVGVTIGDTASARELLNHADNAMYQMKRSRRRHISRLDAAPAPRTSPAVSENGQLHRPTASDEDGRSDSPNPEDAGRFSG